MNNARPKAVAEINLEEFERRLRASAAPQAGIEDPLAELTRLVDTIGFERSAAERALEIGRAPPKVELPPPAPVAPPPVAQQPPLAPPHAPPPPPAAQPPLAPPPIAATEPEPTAEAAASPQPREVEPLLRPALDSEDLDAIAFEPPPPSEEPVRPTAPSAASPGIPPQFGAPDAPARGRGWTLKVGGLIAAAAVMAAAVVVFKVGGHARSGAPPLIMASTAPTKVAPPSEETVRTAGETGALLTHDTAQATPTPPKLVDTPEAPVDLSARAEAAPSPQPSAASPAPVETSPVAPSTDTPIVATATPTATPSSPASSDPNRVKTISVRPDGTLIASSYESSAQAAAPAPPPVPAKAEKPASADADGEAASPPVALPTKLSPPKSSARVVAKTDTTAPPDAGAGPVTPKPKKPKPTPTLEADAKTDDAADVPAPASGGWAVQFAAPRSPAEAKSAIKRLEGRYADALGGASLGVRKADRGGEAIYRVRAGGLSKADAAAMCAKVKAAGGDCFIAKN